MTKQLIAFLMIVSICCSWTANTHQSQNADQLFTDGQKGKVADEKKYAAMGCIVKRGEKPKIKCDLAPGTCKKLKDCTPISLAEGELDEDEIDQAASDFADSMVAGDYIDPENWTEMYHLASSLLHDNAANEELSARKTTLQLPKH